LVVGGGAFMPIAKFNFKIVLGQFFRLDTGIPFLYFNAPVHCMNLAISLCGICPMCIPFPLLGCELRYWAVVQEFSLAVEKLV
jgi:hypothetical protein